MVGWQPKLTFYRFYKACENFVTYSVKQNEVLMGKPKHLGRTVLEISKLLERETDSALFQP